MHDVYPFLLMLLYVLFNMAISVVLVMLALATFTIGMGILDALVICAAIAAVGRLWRGDMPL